MYEAVCLLNHNKYAEKTIVLWKGFTSQMHKNCSDSSKFL